MNLELIKSAASRYLGRGIYQAVELRHSGFSQDWLLINGTKGITIDGVTYEAFPFALTLSPQGDNAGASLQLANVDRRITEELSAALTNESIIVDIYIVHIEKKGTIIEGERYHKGQFEVINAEVTQDAVSLGVALRSSVGYNASSLRFNKNDFGNIYL